jgi:hypothetical protein
MNRVEFCEPNFRARVREKSRHGAKPYYRLLYAENEAVARSKLEELGFEVLSLKTYNFSTWKSKAKIATSKALSEYPAGRKDFKFSSELWGELKDHLQDMFSGRCAYCEALFLSVSFGDVEHYRPKAEVTDEANHLGYYWLAYEPSNYLPSCMLCNQKAKRNYFPIEGVRASSPADDLQKEEPMLFNPYNHNYFDYICYIPSRGQNGLEPTAGKAVGISKRGEESVKIYDLDREWLIRKRRKAQISVRALLKEALSNENTQALSDLLIACLSGTEEFSTAVATEIDHFYKTMNLGSPFPGIKLGIDSKEKTSRQEADESVKTPD